ncbi:hypothetical protein [Natrinema sp. 1APR25-10V2]|uniref:hypothetical protein n=1 Tax=Natrinema sp. 1APR25-10V2 TaxID=2951081 RepID=UPI002876CEE8|nr:hypothetical protein [Natrinema sp. 1APR25-10V2]MDS0474998.1 hypothetical protein [Natrinema sp. 1APR25-10V2]
MRNEFDIPTPTTDEDPVAAVRRQGLPDTVLPLIDSYDDIAADRDRFLWRWLYQLFPTFRLSCVDDDRAHAVRDAKLVATIFAVVADDVAEQHGDRATFDELVKVPFDDRRPDPSRRDVDGDVVRLVTEVWGEFSRLYDASPRSAEFAELLRFDLEQVVRAVEYSYLANETPGLVSERELWAHDVHNMMIYVYADIDLASAPSFDSDELSLLRQVCDRTQRMARIGNWVSTWKRELAEGDCSSGVVVHALENDIVSRDRIREIRRDPADAVVSSVIEAIDEADVEDHFLARWRAEYQKATQFESEVDSVDLEAYLEGFERILGYHIASEGHK